MKNKFLLMCLFLFAVLAVPAAYADNMEELSTYFEIRDTIQLMNDEMENALKSPDTVSLFDEKDIELKIESFIGFMKHRVSVYASSDSKLKFHYIKKLDNLLHNTSNLFAQARPVIQLKRDAKSNKQSNPIPPVSYSTITHPYFDSIDFRTLASREPLSDDPKEIKAVAVVPVAEKKPENKKKEDLQAAPVLPKDVAPATTENAKPSSNSNNKANDSKNAVVAKPSTDKPTVAAKPAAKATVPAKPSTDKPTVAAKPAEKTTVSAKSSTDKATVITKPVETAKTAVADKKSEQEVKPVITDNTPAITGDFMRPMAIMIENHNQARPQSGLYKADVLYEIPVEGGITRFMGLFTQMPGLVGPVRSCREYFVDRALEVDALYVHCGGSPMGYAYISKSKIRSIDEIKNSPPFFRDKVRKAPHNLYGNGDAIYKYMAKRVDMRVTTKPIPLSYGIRTESGEANGDYLKINYHGNYNVVCKYENGVYHRYMNNILHLDRETQKPLEASAIVLQTAAMRVVDSVGRQEISFIGSGSAWIFENGHRTKVTWYKASPREKTVYIDKNGNEYLFAEKGQVWVQVISPNHKIFFEPVKETAKPAVKPAVKDSQKRAEKSAKESAETKAKAGSTKS